MDFAQKNRAYSRSSMIFLRKIVLGSCLLVFPHPAQAYCSCLKCATGIWRSYHPQSGSMKPTLEPGGCFIIKRGDPIHRGSILVFRHSVSPEMLHVSRLIGLPGDVIEMKDGRVILNGVGLPQAPVAPYAQIFRPEGSENARPRCPDPVADGATCSIPRFTETLPDGTAYDVLDIDQDSFVDNGGPFVVPPNHVFVLGDNRDNSNDSRFAQLSGGIGFVPAANILGPVVEITNPAP